MLPVMPEPVLLTERALERRVRRWLASGPFEGFVQAAPGLEDVTAGELAGLGVEPVATAEGGVAVRFGAEGVMLLNLRLRTASRVLLRFGSFPAAGREMLFDRMRRLPWEVELGLAGSYRLHMVSRRSALQAGDELQQIAVDAISRRLRELGRAAHHDDASASEVHLRLHRDYATVSLNTSGEHLHRRGFRRYVGDAPLRETVAAALFLEAFDGHDLVVDPFCGSGTLLLEAAEISAGRTAGRLRRFAFEDSAWFRPGLYREVQRRAKALEAAVSEQEPRLLGFDSDAQALTAAAGNLRAAGHGDIALETADALTLDLSGLPGRRRLLLANLPFGRRLGDRRSARDLHQEFLGRVRENGPWDLGLVTTHPDLVRAAGLTVHSERQVLSGGLRLSLVRAST